MKKFISLSVLILLAIASFSQTLKNDFERENFFRIGGKAGVNINKIHGQSFKSEYSYNYLLGGFMQFNFSERFGIQPEVNFVQSSSHFADNATDVYDDIFADGRQKEVKMNYLKVPVFLNMNIGPSKRVKLQIGPQIGGLLKETSDSLRTVRKFYRKTDWSAVGGLWIQLPFINIGGRYEQGLSNINRKDDSEKWHSSAFTLFAGFTF